MIWSGVSLLSFFREAGWRKGGDRCIGVGYVKGINVTGCGRGKSIVFVNICVCGHFSLWCIVIICFSVIV